MSRQQHIVIVGAGIVGLATAYALLQQGMERVTVLEQAVVDHARSTSSGFSRLLRCEYGPDAFYARMVKLSLSRWRALERETQARLYTPTGLLILGNQGDGFTRESFEIARGLGCANEQLADYECEERFPQFDAHPYELLTYNPTAGILHASVCLQALKSAILAAGGRIHEKSRVTRIAHAHPTRPIRVYGTAGEELTADRVVVAIGPWVQHLLTHLRLPIEITRQYVLYFAGLSPATFGADVFPAFMNAHLYGFPIHKGGNGWLKATSHSFGASIEPDVPPVVDERTVDRIAREICELLPALRNAKLAHIDTCMYDLSPDEDFILDHVPDDPRIVFATGLSGHGFKFGPLLGELLSSLVCDTQPPLPLERFRLARFSHTLERQAISVA